ncbi:MULTISPECIES: hypothetical protein [unclassified Solwaraspora]|uniref:hypothetical protein n=1 Tax=unclassified Solwaraspora TaxID=2627926 RepID=UPI00248B3B9D|nr:MULTISPECIES: hypothetical protein [unclassified Solwaraspora]WBB97641.1 hypothetical protein O7553_01225 [Solwaraspora sp. WMMA2059]WBC18466.1 hypothetical protein O7543_16105 [Solwaraspora sp. WMMA2080]WJK34120.1 hypothetical protein O7610_26400 [Solwaraspora sp. WMMA2065]
MNPPRPTAIPAITPGTVLRLGKNDWRYGGHNLILQVEQMRPDLSAYYDNRWVWIIGRSLGTDGGGLGRMVALVRVAALPGAPRADAADAG